MKLVEIKQHLPYVLRYLMKPEKLETSPFSSMCLVKQRCLLETTISYQALVLVLTEVREQLGETFPEDADLLNGRFWEGLSVQEMIATQRPKLWAERTFYNKQKEAINRFAQLLAEREKRCGMVEAKPIIVFDEERKVGEKRPFIISFLTGYPIRYH